MNKKLSPRLTGLIFCLFSFYQAHAQIPQGPVNVQSPNAASLGVFGNLPVSHYTGLPTIQVPLYTLEQKETSVPIVLNYHASGFKPDMHPGWVGTDWNLASGGTISRVINDAPDDYSNGNYYLGANMGYYYNHGVLNTGSWNQTGYMQSIARGDHMIRDTEPDEFSFSFGGYNGTFYLDAAGNWKVKCDKPIKVTLNGAFLNSPFSAPYSTRMQQYGMSQSFGGFIITTEDGTKYYFGGNTNAIEYSISFFAQDMDEWIAGSWHLTKIVGANGEEVNFQYERDNYVNQMYISILNNISSRAASGGSSCSFSNYSQVYHNYNGKLIAPAYLTQISGLHTIIKFSRSTSTELRYEPVVYEYRYSYWATYGGGYSGSDFLPILTDNGMDYYPNCLNKLQWKKLDEIRVEKTDGTLVKAFNFSYNNNSTERLKLLSVTEQGRDLNSKPPHVFSYDQSVTLPGYLSNKVDHWGYYNGTYADMSNQSNYYNTYYNYRNPVSTYLLGGILNKITYPTGGVTDFIYEPHNYSRRLQQSRSAGLDNSFNTNTLAGGLRIRKISSYDAASPLQKNETEYFYVRNYNNGANVSTLMSSGILGGQIRYYFDGFGGTGSNGIAYVKSIFSSQSLLPGLVNSYGNHVGYSEVVEKKSDGSYTKFTYTNYDNGNLDEGPDMILQSSHTEYEPYASREEERGKIYREDAYNATNILISSTQWQYTALNKANEYVPSVKVMYEPTCFGWGIETGTAHKIYTYSYVPSSKSTTIYDVNGAAPVTAYQTFDYNLNYRLLSQQTLVNSDNKEVKISYKYPYDLATSEPVYAAMLTKNIVHNIVEETKLVNNAQVSKKKVSFAESYAGKFFPVLVYNQITSSSVLRNTLSNTFNSQGSLVSASGISTPSTCYIYGYGGLYVIAKIDNADYVNSVVPALGGAAAIENFKNVLNPTEAQVNAFLQPLRVNASLSRSLITTYTYLPHAGMASTTDHQSHTTYYEYDSFQRLYGIKDFTGAIVKTFDYHYRP